MNCVATPQDRDALGQILLLNNGLNPEQLWKRSKLSNSNPLPSSLPLSSFFLILWLNTGDNRVLFEPVLWKQWSSFLSPWRVKGAPCSCRGKGTKAAFTPLCCHVLRATSPRQTWSFNLRLSGKLMQRAMKQACKLVYLKGCTLPIWR